MRIMKSGAFWRNGFSLMEVMVVLLIVAIIAAASAPMVTKKMSRNAGTGDSPWVFTGLSNNIAYLGGNNGQVLVGAAKAPSGDKSRIFISGKDGRAHIGFGNADDSQASHLTFNIGNAEGNGSRIGMTNVNSLPENSVAFGGGQYINNAPSSVTIGAKAKTYTQGTVTIGANAITGYNGGGEGAIAIGDSAKAINKYSIAIGCGVPQTGTRSVSIGAQTYAEGTSPVFAKNYDAIAIGTDVSAKAPYSIAIGKGASNGEKSSSGIAIGNGANTNDTDTSSDSATAIGPNASATGNRSMALGMEAEATNIYSTAIGYQAKAKHYKSTAIGFKVETTADNQIVLGDENTRVYIPGQLWVDGHAVLGYKSGATVVNGTKYWNDTATSNQLFTFISSNGDNKIDTKDLREVDRLFSSNNTVFPYLKWNTSKKNEWEKNGKFEIRNWDSASDRRLKNVGKAYTAGLEELKKLEFYHYTFKKDEAKTPRVGVMAQDLEKVFPDAVTKGDDGFLRIRWEDMFYAVINAVKELDTKISAIVKDITDVQETIKAQQVQIDELEKQNVELEKRIEKLEKALKKEK